MRNLTLRNFHPNVSASRRQQLLASCVTLPLSDSHLLLLLTQIWHSHTLHYIPQIKNIFKESPETHLFTYFLWLAQVENKCRQKFLWWFFFYFSRPIRFLRSRYLYWHLTSYYKSWLQSIWSKVLIFYVFQHWGWRLPGPSLSAASSTQVPDVAQA